MTASVGCGDDGSSPIQVIDGGASSGNDTSSNGNGGGGASSEATSEQPNTDNLTVGGSGTADDSSPTGPDSMSLTHHLDTTGAFTSDVASTGQGTAAQPTETVVVDTSSEPPMETISDDAIDPPDDMFVITSFDAIAGFPDGEDNVNVVRTYGGSLMSLDISFSTSGQQAGVNFNFPNGSGDLCGHDFVARIRRTSGTIDGGIQMRVWSDSWGQFSSQITSLNGAGIGEWVVYRLTWSQAVANDNLNNGVLDIHAINAVGLEFMTFGASTDVHYDVDWLGLVPSDTPCPDVSGPDAGSSTGTNDATADAGVTTTSEVDGSVVDTSAPPVDVDGSVVDTSSPQDMDASAPADPNILTNSNFDTGATTGWFNYGGSAVSATTAQAYSGTYSLVSSGRTATWNGLAVDLLAGDGVSTPVVQGRTYHASAYVRIVGAASSLVGMGATVTCDASTTYPWIGGDTATDSGWLYISGDFTVPTCTTLETFTFVINQPASGVEIYVDDVSIEEVP